MKNSGCEFGCVFLVCDGCNEELMAHEYGHAIQNCMLGIFIMPLAVISIVRFWIRRLIRECGYGEVLKPYDSYFYEGWASRLGKKYIKMEN